jgi:hypothetical protein
VVGSGHGAGRDADDRQGNRPASLPGQALFSIDTARQGCPEMTSSTVPHNDFNAGFVVGYQLIRGTAVGIPGIPGAPGTAGNTTPFLNGIRAGIKAAGGTLNTR